MARRDHHGSGIKKTATRLGNIRQYGTGIDPTSGYIDFLKKDAIQNIDVHRDTVKRIDDLESRRDKYPVGCTKKFSSNKPQNPAVSYEIPTDHISFQTPKFLSQSPLSLPRYTKSNTSKDG